MGWNGTAWDWNQGKDVGFLELPHFHIYNHIKAYETIRSDVHTRSLPLGYKEKVN